MLWENIGFCKIYLEIGLLAAEVVRLTDATVIVYTTPKIKLNSIKLWIYIKQRCKWGHYSYSDLPERYKPSPLIFIFKDWANKKKMIAPETTRIFLFDLDAY